MWWPSGSSQISTGYGQTLSLQNFLIFLGMVALLGDCPNEMLSVCLITHQLCVSGQNENGASAPLSCVSGRLSTFRSGNRLDERPYPGKSRKCCKQNNDSNVFTPRTFRYYSVNIQNSNHGEHDLKSTKLDYEKCRTYTWGFNLKK